MKLFLLFILFTITLAFNSCDLCKDLVGIIERQSNSSINIIEKIIHDICETIIIKPEKDECLLIADDIHNITQWIIDGLHPGEICVKLHLCNNTYNKLGL